jgi:hypothetical protein
MFIPAPKIDTSYQSPVTFNLPDKQNPQQRNPKATLTAPSPVVISPKKSCPTPRDDLDMIFYKKILKIHCNKSKELQLMSKFIKDISAAPQPVSPKKQEFPLQTQLTFVSNHPSKRSVCPSSRLCTIGGQDGMIDENGYGSRANSVSPSRRLYLKNLKQRIRHNDVEVSKLDHDFALNLMNLERCLQENANRKVGIEAG